MIEKIRLGLRKSDRGLWNTKPAQGFLFEQLGGIPHVPSATPDEDYWLERAREAYALSNQMVYPEAKRLMREIAAGYQRLAQSTEERTGRAKPRSR
jgi:hypothetical protein